MHDKGKRDSSKRTRIRCGQVSLPFYPWIDQKTGKTYWRWSWKDIDGTWRYGTRSDKQEAREAAKARARIIASGQLDLDALTATESDLVRQFLALSPTAADIDLLRQSRVATGSTILDALTHWHSFKIAEIPGGRETPHIRNVRQWLEKLANALPGPAERVTADQLRQHVEQASQNAKSRKDARTRIIMLWDFARTHGIFESLEAVKLPKYKPDHSNTIKIWSPDELKTLLSSCPEEFLPWLVLSCYSGLRSGEICPTPGTKPPLRWENIKRDQGMIDLPAKLSKVRKRRLVPVTPVLSAWLDYLAPPATGIVCARLPAAHVTNMLGELVGGWRKNANRHTYGSWRAAETENLPALAIEMGTSYAMIERHYREAMSSEESLRYRSLIPSEVFRK